MASIYAACRLDRGRDAAGFVTGLRRAAEGEVHHAHTFGARGQAQRDDGRDHVGVGGAGVLRPMIGVADVGLDDDIRARLDEPLDAAERGDGPPGQLGRVGACAARDGQVSGGRGCWRRRRRCR